MKLKELAAATLIVVLALGALPANAQEKGVVVDRVDIENALSQKATADSNARAVVTDLLRRDDVKAMASGMGLDVRRAEGAVSSLQGAELQQASVQAATASDLLNAGGTTTIQISVVTLLLVIIIIIILLAD